MPLDPDRYGGEEEKLRRFKNRVRWAETDQRSHLDEGRMFWNYYRNRPKVHTRGGQEITVPIALKNVDAMYAALTAFHVAPVVAQKGLTTWTQARVMDQALKNEWDEIEAIKLTRPALKDGLVTGIGIAKVWYEFADEDQELDADEDADEISANFDELVAERESVGEDFDPDELAEEARYKKVPLLDTVTVDHIPWDELSWDPEAKSWRDAHWILHTYEVPLEEVEDDETIPASAKENLKRDTTITDKWRGDKTKEPSPDEERVVLRDLYDLDTGYVYTFSMGHDKILKEAPIPFAIRPRLHKRNPFVAYVSRTDDGKVVGISDIKAMKPSIDEANVNRSNLTTFIDRFKTKILSETGAITEAGKKALKSQEHGEVVEVEDLSGVKPLDLPDLPSEVWAQDGKALQDADDAVAINELLEGQLPAGRKSATGMNYMAQASSVRQAEKRNNLEDFYTEIADRVLFLMQMFYDQPRITRMVDDYGDIEWEWDNEDIINDVSVTVALEEREILDTAAKQEKYTLLWNIAGADPTINQGALKKYLLSELGIPQEVIREVIKTPEQAEAEAAAAMGEQVLGAEVEAMAKQTGGIPTQPSEVPANASPVV